MIANLKAINKSAYLQDHRLVNELACKLPTDRHIKWIEYKAANIKPGDLPSLEDFGKWLVPQAKVLKELPKRAERAKQPLNVHQPPARTTEGPRRNYRFTNARNAHGPATNKNTARPSTHTAARQWNQTFSCPCGHGSHALYRCNIFKRRPAQERVEIAHRGEQCFA